MKTAGKFIALTLSAALVLGSARSVSAQTFYLSPIPQAKATFGLRFMKVNLAESPDESTFSGSYDFYAVIPTSEGLGFRLSLPYSRMSYDPGPDYFGMPRSRVESTAMGNLYLGIYSTRQISERTKSVLSIGVHLPTASDKRDSEDAAFLGLLANFHQVRRVLPDAWVVYGNMAWRMENSEGSIFGIEIGPEIWIPSGNINADKELLFHYGLSAGAGTRRFAFLAELMGLFVVTEDADNFGDQFEHHLAVGVGLKNYTVRPSLWYQIPLHSGLREVVDGVIGLQVEVSMR